MFASLMLLGGCVTPLSPRAAAVVVSVPAVGPEMPGCRLIAVENRSAQRWQNAVGAVRERAAELGATHVVVTSETGKHPYGYAVGRTTAYGRMFNCGTADGNIALKP